AGECDLVVKGESNHGEKGYLYDVAADRFIGNRRSDAPLSDANLRQRALQDGGELTYTCVPPGSGVRIGIDRNEDGVLDGDEEDRGGAFLSYGSFLLRGRRRRDVVLLLPLSPLTLAVGPHPVHEAASRPLVDDHLAGVATLQAAPGLRGLPTQGVGLRPRPWAKVSRPVGPDANLARSEASKTA
ncbi:MAG: hypothetical protein WAM82_03750, partial [Thermoanaerobaculia bacterium]